MISQCARLNRSTRSVCHEIRRAAARADDRARTTRARGARSATTPSNGPAPDTHGTPRGRRASADDPRTAAMTCAGYSAIASGVDDIERLVDGVAGIHLAFGAHRRRAEHHHVANQRKKARPRRRVPEGHVVHAGAAVRDARQVHAVLVDVVGALQPIEDAREVVDLRRRPPERSHPSAREHRNLLDAARQRVDPDAVDDRRARARDAAMQLKPHLIRAARIVVLRDDERVLVIHAVERAMAAELQAARHVGVVRRARAARASAPRRTTRLF